jgi:hypothetical protein
MAGLFLPSSPRGFRMLEPCGPPSHLRDHTALSRGWGCAGGCAGGLRRAGGVPVHPARLHTHRTSPAQALLTILARHAEPNA